MSDLRQWEPIGPNDDESDFALIHFGVKGMKWGVRKAVRSGVSARRARKANEAELNKPHPDYSSRKRANDQRVGGKALVKKVNQEMNKGMTREQAMQKHATKYANRHVGAAIGKYAARSLVAQFAIMTVLGQPQHSVIGRGIQTGLRAMGPLLMKYGKKRASDLKFTKPDKHGVYNVTTM